VRLLLVISGLLLVAIGVNGATAAPASPVTISNGVVRLVVEASGTGVRETYYVKGATGWRALLEGGSTLRDEPEFKANGVVVANGAREATRLSPRRIRIRTRTSLGVIMKTVTLFPGDPNPSVEVSCQITGSVTFNHLFSTYSFVPGGAEYKTYAPLDFIFSPQLRPEADQVIADHVFRSPALMMQEQHDFVAIVPDVRSIDGKNRALRTAADMQVETAPKPFFSFGLQNWMPEPYQLRNTHVFYVAPDSLSPLLKDTTVSFSYRLFLDASAPLREGFRNVVRYQWKSNGKTYFARKSGPQSLPFSAYIRKAWKEYLPTVALDAQYEGKPVTLLRQARLAWSNGMHRAADNDAWFNVWFNSLRTAYGMELHGRETHDTNLTAMAERVLNLALLAPQHEGIAPTIFYLDSTGGHWVGDHAWGGIGHGEFLPMFHNAWTGVWLLRWAELLPSRREEIIRFTRAFGEFLLKHQNANGEIPSWYDPETLEPATPFKDENAETAGAALFLAELYARTSDPRYLEGAEKAIHYIRTEIVPARKWFDFETFFSCSRKPLGFFDTYTQQPPQNTLSMHQAAEACNALFHATHKDEYKREGEAILDYLCLYQQVWSPRWLSRELFGGFGVQNTDAEWSDSRQGYFAVTLMDYYDLTGRQEYLERGVAALRAMFSLFESDSSPRTNENYAHSGTDAPTGVTGLHWGTGSSVTSIHILRQRYGDAHVNLRAQWGAGIDGCTVSKVAVRGSAVSLVLVDNVAARRSVLLTFGGVSLPKYSVQVNGKKLGTFLAADLKKGVTVEL
jgi:hypothetical protein